MGFRSPVCGTMNDCQSVRVSRRGQSVGALLRQREGGWAAVDHIARLRISDFGG
jgi:hypothetical protein